MNLPAKQKHFLTFSRKLFLSVIALFLVSAVCFIALTASLMNLNVKTHGDLAGLRAILSSEIAERKKAEEERSLAAAVAAARLANSAMSQALKFYRLENPVEHDPENFQSLSAGEIL